MTKEGILTGFEGLLPWLRLRPQEEEIFPKMQKYENFTFSLQNNPVRGSVQNLLLVLLCGYNNVELGTGLNRQQN